MSKISQFCWWSFAVIEVKLIAKGTRRSFITSASRDTKALYFEPNIIYRDATYFTSSILHIKQILMTPLYRKLSSENGQNMWNAVFIFHLYWYSFTIMDLNVFCARFTLKKITHSYFAKCTITPKEKSEHALITTCTPG